MKRISLDLSDDLHRKLKIQCVHDGISMADLLRKLAEEYLAKAEKLGKKH